MDDKFSKFHHALKNNPFTYPAYSCGTELENSLYMIARFCDRDSHIKLREKSLDELHPDVIKSNIASIAAHVPPFQRDNDKWSCEMQHSYILNILKGYKGSPICLYTLDDTKTNCFVLDGLQRITAISRFLSDQDMKFCIQGETITASELLESDLRNRVLSVCPFDIKIYQFKDEIEAVDFYIEFNKNITHSKDDIQRAEKYRKAML